jgi:chitinase
LFYFPTAKDVIVKARQYKFVCYVGTWANYWTGDGTFKIEDIDPQLCTHVIYGFSKIENDRITEFDAWLDKDTPDGLGEIVG